MSKVNFNQHYYVIYLAFILCINSVNSAICPVHNYEFSLITNTCSLRTSINQGVINHYTIDNNFDGHTISVKISSHHHSLYSDNFKYDYQSSTTSTYKPLNKSSNGDNYTLYVNVTELKLININDITFYDVLSVYWLYLKQTTRNITNAIWCLCTNTGKSVFYYIMNGIYFMILKTLGILQFCVEFLIIGLIKIITISFKFCRDYFTNLYHKAINDL